MPREADPELARHSDLVLDIALGYWTRRNINSVANGETDADVAAVTRLVNPALRGLADRQANFRKALDIFTRPARAVGSIQGVTASPAGAAPSPASPNAAITGALQPELSGPQWVARFPTSVAIGDLAATFAAKVRNFIDAVRAGGATVRISATFRPKERAYLMHWAWEIGRNLLDPDTAPPMTGVPIRWAHPELAQSRLAARQMVSGYGMVQNASLNSRHADRLAIDMTISWSGSLSIRQQDGSSRRIDSQPRNGSNRELVAVGAGYGVFKLASDPPHWSDDGR